MAVPPDDDGSASRALDAARLRRLADNREFGTDALPGDREASYYLIASLLNQAAAAETVEEFRRRQLREVRYRFYPGLKPAPAAGAIASAWREWMADRRSIAAKSALGTKGEIFALLKEAGARQISKRQIYEELDEREDRWQGRRAAL